jgi:hypothetical protein
VARRANNPDRYKNLRTELWHEMREWLNQDMPVQIPDDPELQIDLCSLGYKESSFGGIELESKPAAKLRGVRSPDRADALMITFAMGQHPAANNYQPNRLPEHTRGMFT